MFEGISNLIKASRPLQFALVFLAGGTVVALFYPTKQIKETLQKTFDQQTLTLKQQHAQELSTVRDTYSKQVTDLQTTNSKLTSKVSELTNQVSSLKSHQEKTFTKIIHPDGTIEIKAVTVKDSDREITISTMIQQEIDDAVSTSSAKLTSEFHDQLTTKQSEWDTKEKDYQHQIATLTQSKEVTINPKNLTVDVGVLTDRDYYGHITYPIWGPFIFGLQAQFGPSSAAGAGLGLRF